MKKETFDKLPKAKQRIVIVKDVLARINTKRLIPESGTFCDMPQYYKGKDNFNLKYFFTKSKIPCEACAKGGLFMSFVSIQNEFKRLDEITPDLNNKAMVELSNIFSKKQLALIETAFEQSRHEWNNSADLSEKDVNKCYRFYDKNRVIPKELEKKADKMGLLEEEKLKDKIILVAICKNIIKNNGTFKP